MPMMINALIDAFANKEVKLLHPRPNIRIDIPTFNDCLFNAIKFKCADVVIPEVDPSFAKLPFVSVFFELALGEGQKMGYLASEGKCGALGFSYFVSQRDSIFMFPGTIILNADLSAKVDYSDYGYFGIPNDMRVGNHSRLGGYSLGDLVCNALHYFLVCLYSINNAHFNRKKVLADNLKQAKKSYKRMSSGRLPLFTHKELVIKDKAIRLSPGHSHEDRNVVTRRAHLRRGHWRTLSDGRMVWVKACSVGDAKKGIIVNDYQVVA